MTDRRRLEAAGIWLSHGLLDSVTTGILFWSLGSWSEENPIMAHALEEYHYAALVLKAVVVACVAVGYPSVARLGRFPNWFGPLLVAVGLVASLGNLALFLSLVF